ncbi:hypothetical protein, partial [Escherichia coli]|uniref:hypothetical protein n=1 Tax=Escherichia coli TaxID=562 RepID=UPI0021149F64
DRNRSHWSTSKTPSYTKSVSWQHHHKCEFNKLEYQHISRSRAYYLFCGKLKEKQKNTIHDKKQKHIGSD